jgi:hypothetical protein
LKTPQGLALWNDSAHGVSFCTYGLIGTLVRNNIDVSIEKIFYAVQEKSYIDKLTKKEALNRLTKSKRAHVNVMLVSPCCYDKVSETAFDITDIHDMRRKITNHIFEFIQTRALIYEVIVPDDMRHRVVENVRSFMDGKTDVVFGLMVLISMEFDNNGSSSLCNPDQSTPIDCTQFSREVYAAVIQRH